VRLPQQVAATMCRERILVQNAGITSKALANEGIALFMKPELLLICPLFPATMGQPVVDNLAAWFAGKPLLTQV
jgi:hypothetical protein